MTAQSFQQRPRLNTSRKHSPGIGRKGHGAATTIGLSLILLAWASLAGAADPIGTPTPPPAPSVAPIISQAYPTDLDGNRINDALEQTTSGTGGLSIAEEAAVKVELIFSEPVTQGQIDAFLSLGGQITYIYKAISYGWNGIIPAGSLDLLPEAMGETLVQVEPTYSLQPYMDMATQTARVRPIWKAGFAGHPTGLSGSANTTIGFIGDGVDGVHADLKGRCIYWKDFTDDNESSPVDFYGHDSAVVGVAVGTGQAGGAETGELRYTLSDAYPYPVHIVDPICLPAGTVTVTAKASWTGGDAGLDFIRWTFGTEGVGMDSVGDYRTGGPPLSLANTFYASNTDVFVILLGYYRNLSYLDGVVINATVSSYPAVGDGFNKFRGVAPGCKWAAAKVFDRNGHTEDDTFKAALDDLVSHRIDKRIKIINISHGLYDDEGYPAENTSLRNKVNSVVNNGVVVVAAAGNSAASSYEADRKMADPPRAAMAITVGASSDLNLLTNYSTYGFFSPRTNAGEDYKPDVIAPGGSSLCTSIMSVDSSTADGYGMDEVPDDYANMSGTSFAAPFVAGCAALVIEAMEKQGAPWNFESPDQPKLVKMLLCATAGEANAMREGVNKNLNPILNRAEGGPNAFPVGKDAYEGYGLINPDAAVEAVSQTYTPGAGVSEELGGSATARRVWARTVSFKADVEVDLSLDVPADADFDLYLYSMVPSDTGTPVLLRSSTAPNAGEDESLQYTATADTKALLVVKRISGAGAFTLKSIQAGPPMAGDLQAAGGINMAVTITLKATDDGRPNPPGAISYTIASLPKHGRLETVGGAPILAVPAKLTYPADKVVYRPNSDWIGDDSFTFYADDGGASPFGGRSNTATVSIAIVREITLEYQVTDPMDDAHCAAWGMQQSVNESTLVVGQYATGLRFRNIQVPQGALIKSATLKICSSTSGLTGQLEAGLWAEAADNPEDFSWRKISQLTKTDVFVPWVWSANAPWTASTWYDSPDIANIVQEVVDRPGWESDNAMVIVLWPGAYSGSDRKIWAYDGHASSAAKLVVTYQPR